MFSTDGWIQDVMQVCLNGHVVTDLLRSSPERARTHCDHCGAATLARCLTCGGELPGALAVPGLTTVGSRQPPLYCPACGAAFPWTKRPRPAPPGPLPRLEALLRRLPLVIRQLRVRQGDCPPFHVQDERDLEDLLRAILPLQFDDIRPQCRTPRYALATRTDYLLAPERIVLTAKLVRSAVLEPQLVEQLREDIAYYRQEKNCRTVMSFLYDPEGLLRDTRMLTIADEGEPELRCVLGSPQ